MPSTRALAVGGVVGPVGFVAAWVGCGLATPGYSPVNQAISELAAVGAPTRWAMTAGFVVFGIGVSAFSVALRRTFESGAWVAALVCALATLGVAAVPLGWFSDGLHGAFAGIGYVALALTPVLAAPSLDRGGHRGFAAASIAVGIACGLFLVAVTISTSHGFFQRTGLFIGDAWLVACAASVLAGRLGPSEAEAGRH